MPSDEVLHQQAEEWKVKGNEAFGSGKLGEAVSAYSQGIVACDRTVKVDGLLKATLLSNRAFCYLKQQNFKACIEDCTTALDCKAALSPQLRCKILFRRAKAAASSDDAQAAARDLVDLLQVDPTNSDAQVLLNVLRSQHKYSSTPASKTLQSLKDGKDVEHNLRVLLGLLDQDLSNTAAELGRLDGFTTLFEQQKSTVLAIQAIRAAAGHPPTLRQYLVQRQGDLVQEMERKSGDETFLVSCLAVWVRILLHADRDDPETDISGATVLHYDCIVRALMIAISQSSTTVLRAVLDVLSTWMAGTDRDSAIRAALSVDNVADKAVPVPKTAAEIRAFTPQELAKYRKRQYDQQTRDEAWAFERALLFCKSGGLQKLLKFACACEDPAVRRECTVGVGRVLACIEDEDKLKSTVLPFLQRSASDEPEVVEEVFDEEEKAAQEEILASSLETKMERAMMASALLLSKKEVGVWAMSTGWAEADRELSDLIASDNRRAQGVAAEVLSAAATAESAKGIVTSLVNNGSIEKLIRSEDRDIRSGAAAAVAKLGLSENATKDEGETMGLLQAACELLEDQDDEKPLNVAKNDVRKELRHFSSFATSSVERAIEMITYLIPSTTVKEELAAGFAARIDGEHTALDLLVKTADLPSAGESLAGFGLATIFQNMAATNEQLRKEAFEGKEVTLEQYNEMQRMGKTEEEKEIMDKEKDIDTNELCRDRIRSMANANVPRALVSLTEGASEHTLEQLAMAMNRMAEEPTVRGVMIQQGVLSACIKIEKNEGPTETDVMKKVIRLARHCIAKMLITTNPSLLTSAQRLGSIRPLIQLVRDIKATDLQHFEALMAVTNVASSGEDAKNRIVTEKGIPSFHFAMFSDHEMVRRAATEAMCNLVPHRAMTDHLAEDEHLRLWFAFAVDFEENYECARAATGCLAMASQDELIAQEIVKLEKFRQHTSALLESGRLEIMHRTFVLVLNLVQLGSEIRAKVISEGLVEFCRAYIELRKQQNGAGELEFPEEERKLLPVTVDIAKEIVLNADE